MKKSVRYVIIIIDITLILILISPCGSTCWRVCQFETRWTSASTVCGHLDHIRHRRTHRPSFSGASKVKTDVLNDASRAAHVDARGVRLITKGGDASVPTASRLNRLALADDQRDGLWVCFCLHGSMDDIAIAVHAFDF